MLVRPITTKPARRSRATTGASASAGAESSSAREPARVTWPLMSNRSLIETGMPANGDGAALTSRSRSIASAASIAASASTRMKARSPSPLGSAMLARQASTNLRALVRPAARSSASAARVGWFGMDVLTFSMEAGGGGRLRHEIDIAEIVLDFQVEQRGAERLAMRVQRQRPGHAAAERLLHHEIQRAEIGQFITGHIAGDDAGKMGFHPRTGDLRLQQRIILRVIGDHRDIGGVSLVAGAGMGDVAQLHHASTKRTCGRARSRGSGTEATATTSRADLVTPPPAA